MGSKTVFVVCLVLVPCVLGAVKRIKRQSFPGIPSINMQDMLDKAQDLSQHALDLAQQTLNHGQLTPEQQQQLSQAAGQLNNLPGQQNPPNVQIPSVDLGHLVQGMFSNLTSDQNQDLSNLMTNQNYQNDMTKLAQKYGSNIGSDAYNEEVKALTQKYLNGGAGLVVSLFALLACLVVQGLMFG